MTQQLKHILFDLDNTLINTEKIKKSFIDIALQSGIETEGKAWEIYDEARKAGGSIKITLDHFLDVLESHVMHLDRNNARTLFEHACREGLSFDGVKDLLTILKERTIPFSILTLGIKEWQDEKIRAAGIDRYFSDDKERILYTERVEDGKVQMLKEKFGDDFTGEGYILFNDKPDETRLLLEVFPKLEVYIHTEHVDKKYGEEFFKELKSTFKDRVVVAKSFSDVSAEFSHRFFKEPYSGKKFDITNVGVVILAAGDGKRMKSGIPKVMHLLHGKPLIEHIVEKVESLGLRPILVVSSRHTQIQDYLGERVMYIVQDQQLGTGHAVEVTSSLLKQQTVKRVVVLYGDMPFVSADTIIQLLEKQEQSNSVIIMSTCQVKNFEDEYSSFKYFSRIIRDDVGEIIRDVQIQDATVEELEIKEINTSFYCFDAEWLWSHLKKLETKNNQKEFYLTDLISMAVGEGRTIASISVDYKEAYGITTPDDLKIAHLIT